MHKGFEVTCIPPWHNTMTPGLILCAASAIACTRTTLSLSETAVFAPMEPVVVKTHMGHYNIGANFSHFNSFILIESIWGCKETHFMGFLDHLNFQADNLMGKWNKIVRGVIVQLI